MKHSKLKLVEKMNLKIIITAFLFLALYGCYKVPISGRRQLNLLPESMIDNMALTSF